MAKKSKSAVATAVKKFVDDYDKKSKSEPEAASVNGVDKAKLSTLDKLIAKHTEKTGQAPDSKTVGVLQLQAAYLDGRKAAGIGRSAPRTQVTELFKDELERRTITAGDEIVDWVKLELPDYKIYSLTLQIRDGESKLRAYRINRPRKPKK